MCLFQKLGLIIIGCRLNCYLISSLRSEKKKKIAHKAFKFLSVCRPHGRRLIKIVSRILCMKYNYFEILTGEMFEINSQIDFFLVKMVKMSI